MTKLIPNIEAHKIQSQEPDKRSFDPWFGKLTNRFTPADWKPMHLPSTLNPVNLLLRSSRAAVAFSNGRSLWRRTPSPLHPLTLHPLTPSP
ncbi:MAG: hypothetical protein ACOYXB_04145, partial [Bacteroidota bacterium]